MIEDSPDHAGLQSSRDHTPGIESQGHRDDHANFENSRNYSLHNNNMHSGIPVQQYLGSQQPTSAGQSASPFPPMREQSPNVYDLSHIGSSLPSYQHQGPQYHESHRYAGGMGGMGAYNHHQIHNNMNSGHGQYPMLGPSYGSSYHDTPTSQMYGQMQAAQRSYSGGPSPTQPNMVGGPYSHNIPSQYMLYPGQLGPMASSPGYNQAPDSFNADMGHRHYPAAYTNMPAHSSHMMRPEISGGPHGGGHHNVSTGSIPSAPRGPPRKPKQSGHALWVGNLPTGTAVGDLKDHFSKDATRDIESVFLISKSNCAFVNYRTDTACAAAMQRFHDSRFQGVRLVCRLRRGPNATTLGSSPAVAGAPLGPAAQASEMLNAPPAPDAVTQNRQISSKALEDAKIEAHQRGQRFDKVLEKFFVMKSLTVEDMELSAQNKIWATQEHNEDTMNKAYATAENVYLIFSANKSGEYFGYARMASPINDEVSATLDWAPKGGVVVDDPDIPRSIPTPATETAPKGRIIDDSARGTIFWEAILDDAESKSGVKEATQDNKKGSEEPEEGSGTSSPQSFGKPFKIEWLSTDRLPFYRTRGLRNSWNANREVKIARDGTELEPSVGRRLIMMFHESHPPVNPRMLMGSPALQSMPR